MGQGRPDMLDPNEQKDRTGYVCTGHGWRHASKPCPTCLKRWTDKPWTKSGDS